MRHIWSGLPASNGRHFAVKAFEDVKMLHLFLFCSVHHLSAECSAHFLHLFFAIIICFTDLKNWIKNRLAAALERCAMMHPRDKQFLRPLQAIAVGAHHSTSSLFFIHLHIYRHTCAQSFGSRHISHHMHVQTSDGPWLRLSSCVHVVYLSRIVRAVIYA